MKNKDLSIIMIARDESAVIRRALMSAVKVADEIIVVDTGSSDNTKEIAASFCARVFDFKWINDFSAARNFSFRQASCRWVMWLDADDYIPTTEISKINRLKMQKTGDEIFSFFLKSVNRADVSYLGAETITQCKFFPNDINLRFEGRVHETVTGSAYERGYTMVSQDITIEHSGYSDKETVQKKLERNLSLMLISAGFPANTEFFIFRVLGYTGFYAPNVLTVFEDNRYIGCCDPYDVNYPKLDSDRNALMLTRAIDIITRWESLKLEHAKVELYEANDELAEMNRRIEAAIRGIQ
jgi:glycosyltransferase involved in cell wall biosynthesis